MCAVKTYRTPGPLPDNNRRFRLERLRGSWRGLEPVGLATPGCVYWFNHRRILEPIGNRSPAETEAAYYREMGRAALAA